MKVLILSDGKPGHLNQSLALAHHKGLGFETVEVGFRSRVLKAASYVLDRLGLYPPWLFHSGAPQGGYCAVVSTGSETYYANKTLARRLGLPSVAIMLPRGYRLDFDLIVAQEHDDPPGKPNVLSLPINLCCVRPKEVFRAEPGKRYVSLIVGGNSKVFSMNAESFRRQLDAIFGRFGGYDLLVTTSRRTPQAIEKLIEEYPFSRAFIYSRNPVNPIPDFLQVSEYVFLTSDSTSMISEAVSFGKARVEIIPLETKRRGTKFRTMIDTLARMDCLHVFEDEVGDKNRKIDLETLLKGVRVCE